MICGPSLNLVIKETLSLSTINESDRSCLRFARIRPLISNSLLKPLERTIDKSLNLQAPGGFLYVINFELFCFNII